MPVQLGPPLADASRRRFMASIDGRQAVIELDNGAVFKLAKHADGKSLTTILDQKRDEIADAAVRLFEKGHVTDRDGTLELLVTALDL